LTLKWVSSMREIRPQAMVHPKQAALATRCVLPSVSRFSCMASPEILLASSSCTSRWLRVGRAPNSLITFISACVPMVGKPWLVTVFSVSTFLPAVVAAMNAGKSLIPETSCVPRIAALQVLRTHHRANAGTARRPVQSAST
jgi:hypothetical protein